MVKSKQMAGAAKPLRRTKEASIKTAAAPGKVEHRSQAEAVTISARVSPVQHREIRDLASANGETIQTLLLRLLRGAGVRSITEADLLDQRRGEGRVHRRPRSGSSGSSVNQIDMDAVKDQLGQLLPFLGFSGAQKPAPGGLTLVINNYLRPEPTA